ncbi:hypothetical protein LPB19_13165 [Marinobacter salinisoli]|uniref:DUF2975 domain-containing protein n=1 Tax=Marinobacter salinisoli TaxID=2769486 RepID=A0ABX7MPG0_9GAMM|nr:hypothetical protein [Marinobacter salinisoli]QSP94134.1 hypothetical protein LPB19_13165 [Marinobacter salinisoli]
MSSFTVEYSFSVPQSPVKRFLLKQLIRYIGYVLTTASIVFWGGTFLTLTGFYSQDTVAAIMDLLVAWGGDMFAPLAQGGHLVLGTDPNQVGANDVNGNDALLYIAGWISLLLYFLDSLWAGVSGKTISVSPTTKFRIVRHLSALAFLAILFSSVLRFESGMAPDSLFMSGFIAVFISPMLLLSGYFLVFINELAAKAVEYVDNGA